MMVDDVALDLVCLLFCFLILITGLKSPRPPVSVRLGEIQFSNLITLSLLNSPFLNRMQQCNFLVGIGGYGGRCFHLGTGDGTVGTSQYGRLGAHLNTTLPARYQAPHLYTRYS